MLGFEINIKVIFLRFFVAVFINNLNFSKQWNKKMCYTNVTHRFPGDSASDAKLPRVLGDILLGITGHCFVRSMQDGKMCKCITRR